MSIVLGDFTQIIIFQTQKQYKNRKTQHKPPSNTSQKEEKLGSRTKVEPIVKPIIP